MNIDRAVKYLEHNKLKMKLLMILMELGFPQRLTDKLEVGLNKEYFKRNPYLLHVILYSLYSVLLFVVFEVIYYFFGRMFTPDSMFFYLIEIMLFSISIAVYQLKTNFFNYFSGDHFFNILQNEQSEFIIKRIKVVFNSAVYGLFIPMTLPIYVHLVIDFKQFYFIIIYPLLILFLHQFIKIFAVFFWYVNVLVKKILLLKLIFFQIKITLASIVYIGFMVVFGYFFNIYQDGSSLNLTDDFMIKLSILIISVLLTLNGIFYLMRNIPKKIIEDSYRNIIYAEGYKKKKKVLYNQGILMKLLGLGMFHLNEKEKAIYEKDAKKLLRQQNGKAYVLIFGLTVTVVMIGIGISVTKLTDVIATPEEAFFGFYIVLNVFLATTLGYFLLVHKYVSSYAAEGTNHIIYHRIQVNYYQVFKAKLYFNRFLVLAPFIPFFLITVFGITSIADMFIFIIMILYWFGIANLVIKALMLEDFFYPKFSGVSQVGLINNKTSMLAGFYSFYIIYASFIFPYATIKLLEVIDLWIIAGIILMLIYLINFNFYRRSLKLKKAKSISYGGVQYGKGE